jgi:hypothetical protein
LSKIDVKELFDCCGAWIKKESGNENVIFLENFKL